MRVAVFGGSFNPPHMGHALVAAWCVWSGEVDEVWLVPTFRHAFDKVLAPWDDRLRAVHALAGLLPGRLRVDPIEATLPAPSFTIHTLDALRAAWPTYTFRLVVGADVLGQAHAWRAWDRIEREYAPLVVGRSGYPPGRVGMVFPEVSSTEVRRRLRGGEPVDGLVPAAVLPLLGPWSR